MTDEQAGSQRSRTGTDGTEGLAQLRSAVAELRETLDSKVALAWVEFIEPQGELFDSLRDEVLAELKTARERGETSGFFENFHANFERRTAKIGSDLYSLSLRERAFAGLRSVVADEIGSDLASRVDAIAARRRLREAVASVFKDARARYDDSRGSMLEELPTGRPRGRRKTIDEEDLTRHPLRLMRLFASSLSAVNEHHHQFPEAIKKLYGQVTPWFESCKHDLDFVCGQANTVLVPAIMSGFDDQLAQRQPTPKGESR